MKSDKTIEKKSSTKKRVSNRFNSKVKNDSDKVKTEMVEDDTNDCCEKVVSKATTSFNLVEVIIIMIITSIFGILIGSCVTYFKEKVIDNDMPSEFTEFLSVYNDLLNDYYSDVDNDELIEAGIKGMVDYLGDPYSSYLDIEESDSLNQELEGEFVGIGISISTDKDNNICVVEVFDDGPAYKAGFKVGDIIKKVDGNSVEGEGAANIADYIKGEEGTEVEIEILREDKTLVLTAKRCIVEISSIDYSMIDDSKIGYIYVSVFASNTPKQFKNAMDDLIKNGAESVIIDLRSNYGGYLTSGEEIASMFLDKGDVLYQLDTKGVVEKVEDKDEKLYDIEVVVLINGSSASASEILASCLNENIGAKLVGEKSYGKGTVQKAKTLSSGAMVKYTIQEWYTPNGNKVNGVGLTPDYEVVLNKEYYYNPVDENDNQLQKAIEILKK